VVDAVARTVGDARGAGSDGVVVQAARAMNMHVEK
jgi:hypothetical protein